MKSFALILGILGAVTYASACWTTSCELESWAQVGCPAGYVAETTTPCSSGHEKGNVYKCCEAPIGGNPDPAPGHGDPAPGDGDNGGSQPHPGDGGDSGEVADITYAQFSKAVTDNGYPEPGIEKYTIFVASAGPKGMIKTKVEAAMALTQFLHESDGLRAKREYACATTFCPGSYATAGCDAPGQYYYGRGYIQLSWCYNYRPASMDLYGDDRLVHDPDMVAREEQVAWETAFWYWKTSVHGQAGVAEGQFGVTTRAINGALECWGGYQHQARARFEIYKKVRTAFGITTGYPDERGCYN